MVVCECVGGERICVWVGRTELTAQYFMQGNNITHTDHVNSAALLLPLHTATRSATFYSCTNTQI